MARWAPGNARLKLKAGEMAGNTARLYRIEALIRSRGHASFRTLQEALEVSPATLKCVFQRSWTPVSV